MTDNKDYYIEIHDMYWILYRNRLHDGLTHKEAKRYAYDAIERRFRIGEQSIRKIINKVYASGVSIHSFIINNKEVMESLLKVIRYESTMIDILACIEDESIKLRCDRLISSLERHKQELKVLEEINEYYSGANSKHIR